MRRKIRKSDRQLCEAAIGRDKKSKQPHIILCRKPAKFIYTHEVKCRLGVALCEECCQKIEERYGS